MKCRQCCITFQNLLSCMTLDMENFHCTVHVKRANMSKAEYCRSFGLAKEVVKRVTTWAAYYHTSRRSWYPKPEGGLLLLQVPVMRPLPIVNMSLADCNALRNWASSYGAAVRQRTVHQETTMARHGTLPEFMYQRQCEISGKPVSIQGLKGEVLGALEPGAQSLFLLGAQTKMMILAKWSPRVQPWTPRVPVFSVLEFWSPLFFTQESGALTPLEPCPLPLTSRSIQQTLPLPHPLPNRTTTKRTNMMKVAMKKLKIVRTIPLCSKERLEALRRFSWEQELVSEELSVSIIVCSTNHSIRLFKGTGYVDLTSSC